MAKKEPNVVTLEYEAATQIAYAKTTKKSDVVNIVTAGENGTVYNNVLVYKSKGKDTLNFVGTSSKDDLSFSKDGRDLIITRKYNGDQEQVVRVEQYFNKKGTSSKSAVK